MKFTQEQRDSIQNTIADLENSAAIDPAGKRHYEKEIRAMKAKLTGKSKLLHRAQRIARETLRECEDFQTACVDVLQDDQCDPLWEGMEEEARNGKIEGIVRFAEHQLGFNRI